MIGRRRPRHHDQPAIRAARELTDAALISPASRTATGLSSIPNDCAAAWTTAHCPMPAEVEGSLRIAARVTRGAISLSSSGHLPAKLYSNWVKPVTLPPGLARLATRPVPTGSMDCANTIGTVRVACSNGATVPPTPAKMGHGKNRRRDAQG